MKITSVDIFLLNSEEKMAMHPVIVRVNTDEGISGFGEAALSYGNAANGGFGQIKDFAESIIGWCPFKNEAIWDHLYRDTFWGQGGGTVIFAAMSAIDTALWDIKGKYFNVPVFALLGGLTRDKVRTYASQIQFGWGEENEILTKPEQYAQIAKKCVTEGYDAIKVDPIAIDKDGGFGYKNTGLLTYDKLKLYRDRLAAIREAVGPAIDIIVELHTGTDVNSAIQLGKAIEDLNIYYMEECCAPLNPPLIGKVKEKINIPLAGGERVYTRFGYRPFLENRWMDVIQPDLGSCGGISEGKKICDMAHTYEIAVQLHTCGTPIAVAAALQLEAVLPNFLIHEHHSVQLKPSTKDLCIYDYQPVNGYMEIPTKPGIGQELTQKAMEGARKATVQ